MVLSSSMNLNEIINKMCIDMNFDPNDFIFVVFQCLYILGLW